MVKFFTSEFIRSADESANAVFQIRLSASIPRLLIELVLIMSICVFLLIALLNRLSFQELSSMLGVFLMAGIRLMPAFTRITGTIQNFRSALPALDALLEVDQSVEEKFTRIQYNTKLTFKHNLVLHKC